MVFTNGCRDRAAPPATTSTDRAIEPEQRAQTRLIWAVVAPNNINCNTVLPNGKTVGAYVAAGRTALNSVPGTGSPPLDAYHMLTTFKALFGGGSAIDFKNTMSGQASQEFLGNAGNFAYYAIGVGYFSPGILDMGAGGYAVKSAFVPSSPVMFSSLTMPYGQDTSAKLEEGPGLAAGGCGVKTF